MTHLTRTSYSKSLFKSIAVVFLFLLSNTIHAQWVWDGSADGDWHNPANWNLNVVPFNGASVIIASPFIHFPNIEGSTAFINRLDIFLGANLFIGETGTLNVHKISNDGASPPGAIQVHDGILYNQGTINVRVFGNAQNAIYVTGSNGQISNAATSIGVSGTINIDNPTGRGINIEGSAKFFNAGSTLNLGATGTIGGVGIKVSSGTFSNYPNANNNAILNISNTTGNAIAVSDKFYNEGGEINLGVNGAIGQRGLKINPSGIFTNEGNTGIVNIDHTSNNAIYNNSTIENEGTINIGTNISIAENGIYNDGEFINNGIIEIDGMSDSNKYAIYNSNSGVASFLNGSCQNIIIIHSDNIIFDEQNTFTNNGLIIENSSGTSDIQTNNGTIANLNGGTFNIANNNGKTVANIGDRLWLGCSNTAWSNVDNWYPNGVPIHSDVVYFAGGTQPTIGAGIAAYAKELHISNGTTLTNSGYYVGFSDIIIDNGGTITGNGNYYLGENWINNGTFIPGTSTVTFNGPVDAEISGASTNTFNDLIIEKFTDEASVSVEDDFITTGEVLVSKGELNILSGKTVEGALVTITNNGSLTNDGTLDSEGIILNAGTMEGSGTYNCGPMENSGVLTNDGVFDIEGTMINAGTIQGNGTFYCGKDWDISFGTFDGSALTLVMDGSVDAILYCHYPNAEIYNLEVNKSIGKVSAQSRFNILNEMIVKNGTFEMTNGHTIRFKNLTVNSTGTYDHFSGAFIYGDLTNNGTINTTNNSYLTFLGDAQQNIGGTNPTTLGRVFINKTANNIKLFRNCEVSNQLNMLAGNLDLNGNILTMGGIIEGESASSYIYGNGYVTKTTDLNAPATVNIGNLGVEISSTANLGSTTIKRYHQAQMIIGESSIQRYYDISPANNNGLDATVKFYYLDHELNGLLENDLAAFRFDGNTWEKYEATDNDESLNFVETNEINAFSIWSLSTNALLPVDLIDFRAKKTDRDQVVLNWQTATETNNKGFEIEHSKNGEDWQNIGFVAGHGNTTMMSSYTFLHTQAIAGQNYYRLKQVDFDGTFDYSPIRSVYMEDLRPKIQVFPNPATHYANISLPVLESTGQIQINSSDGRTIFQTAIIAGEQLFRLDLQSWPAGTYVVQIQIASQIYTQKLICTGL